MVFPDFVVDNMRTLVEQVVRTKFAYMKSMQSNEFPAGLEAWLPVPHQVRVVENP